MKLATFKHKSRVSYGLVSDGTMLIDIGASLMPRFPTLASLLVPEGLALVEAACRGAPVLPPDSVEWLPPIPAPAKILCIGLNYEEHRQETGRPKADYPAVFMRFPDTQIGHDAPTWLPPVSSMLDYEGELAVVIGCGGRYIPAARALEHVAGYACYNDITVRDWQRHTHQFGPGKNFPRTGPFGPWITTSDEVGDWRDLTLTTRLNGQVMQQVRTGEMLFDIPRLIEYCSGFTPLAPGDVIATGTPGGVGFKRDPQVFMKAGDVVEVEITRVGLLRTPVVAEPG